MKNEEYKAMTTYKPDITRITGCLYTFLIINF
mgnify:CR=1 FL=1